MNYVPPHLRNNKKQNSDKDNNKDTNRNRDTNNYSNRDNYSFSRQDSFTRKAGFSYKIREESSEYEELLDESVYYRKIETQEEINKDIKEELKESKKLEKTNSKTDKTKNSIINNSNTNNTIYNTNSNINSLHIDNAQINCSIDLNPLHSFQNLLLPPHIQFHLQNLKPTEIQQYAIPAIFKNKNIMCRAPTGVGKTIAFLLPLMLKLKYTRKPKLRVLVLTPTRELAIQIKNEADKLSNNVEFQNQHNNTEYKNEYKSFTNGNSKSFTNEYKSFTNEYKSISNDQSKSNNFSNLKSNGFSHFKRGNKLKPNTSTTSTNISKSGVLETRCLYGGTPINHSINQLSDGCDILIATPGRLTDFLNRGIITLKNIRYYVLDEADRMLDMGFEKEMNLIGEYLNRNILTYLFSATFDRKIMGMVNKYLGEDRIVIEYENETIKNIKQEFIYVNKNKEEILIQILKENTANNKIEYKGFKGNEEKSYINEHKGKEHKDNEHKDNEHNYDKNEHNINEHNSIDKDCKVKILVFVERKKTCRILETLLNRNNIKSVTLHGDKVQYERECALRLFVDGKVDILIATSVAARGLHIPNINLVINYDLPMNIKDYIHRIGRCGRCGNKGYSLSFFEEKDFELRREYIGVLKESGNEVPRFMDNSGGRIRRNENLEEVVERKIKYMSLERKNNKKQWGGL